MQTHRTSASKEHRKNTNFTRQGTSRIQEIEKEIKRREGNDEVALPYLETTEYMQEEKEILEETIKVWTRINEPQFIVYLPEILLFHCGVFIESYTYEYDPKKGNEADHFRGWR